MESRRNTISSITNNNLLGRYSIAAVSDCNTTRYIIKYIIYFYYDICIVICLHVRSGTNSKVHAVHTARLRDGFHRDGGWWDEQQVVGTGSRTTGSGRMSTMFECICVYVVILLLVYLVLYITYCYKHTTTV